MRVLHIGKHAPSSAGGIESYLRQLLAASEARGVAVHALVHGVDSPASASAAVTVVRTRGHLLFAPVTLSFLSALDRAIVEFKPDLLHVHVPNLSALWLLASSTAATVPWVLHWHADVAGCSHRLLRVAYRAYAPFESRLLKRSAAVVATSPPYLQSSLALRPWQDKASVIPLGHKPPEHQPDDRAMAWAAAQWRGATARVLFVGRPSYYKGLDDLLAAVAISTDTNLVVVGPGTRAALDGRIRRLSLADRVTVVDYQPADRIQALMKAADCVCLPSTGREEAFGLVAIEAMAQGTPVVASDIPGSGLPWVVQNGVSGVLLPSRNPAALADAFASLGSEPDRWRRLGRGAREMFQRRFHLDRSVDQVLALYEELTATGAQPSRS